MTNPEKYAIDALRAMIDAAVAVARANGRLPDAETPEYVIERPKTAEHGDFSTNIAMSGARVYHMAPRAVAEILTDTVELYDSPFDRCEIAGPGFINFFLSTGFDAQVVGAVLKAGDGYGRTCPDKKEKVMVEFVSANPTGPMHIGNARGGMVGDTLAACLDWAGHDVTREFYVNDAGNQVDRFAQSLRARYMQICGRPDYPFPEDGYHGDDVRELAEKFKGAFFDKYGADDSDELMSALSAFALTENIARMKADLEQFGINYDVWFPESTLHASPQIEQTMNALRDGGDTYEKDGALWFLTTKYGCDKDDVLVKSNGFYTYLAVDIAYHRNKFLVRGFDRVINVWGADHHGHVARMKGTMAALGVDPARLDVVLIQLVRLMRDGEEIVMSKRTGKALKLSDLLEMMPVDSVRFFFNMRSPESHFDVDLDLAVSQTSQNPVYYVQYAHARICSILALLTAEGIDVNPAEADLSLLTAPAEHELIELMARFPQEIIQVTRLYDPSLITHYLIDFATAFHRFYTECRVKDAEVNLRAARICLLRAAGQIISNGCALLGIVAPEKM